MKRPFLASLFTLLLLASSSLAAQLAPPSTGGVPELMRELSKLGHYQRVLMIGAHPDDEDTELLTILSRGMGAETAYLSLTRGEGGQDLIGPELGDALGILRTEELLAARRIDGAQQFFTRAYDFGFSKTIDDAWKHWPQDSVLKDVVRIIRRFRPQIVVSVFSGTPADGHGQHQVAGWAAKRAFEVAGDSTVFPELKKEEGLEPWTPLKLYRSARFNPAATMITLDGGAIDPVTGKTYRQMAMEGRSLHRSQKMGQLQPIGPSSSRVTLWEDRTGKGEGGFWAGVDTTIAGWPLFSSLKGVTRPRVELALKRYSDVLAAIRRAADHANLGEQRWLADSAWAALGGAIDLARGSGQDAGQKRPFSAAGVTVLSSVYGESAEEDDESHHLLNVASAMSGAMFDAVADRQRVAAGDSASVRVVAWNGGGGAMAAAIGVATPPGVASERPDGPPPDTVLDKVPLVESEWVRVAEGGGATTPYFLRSSRVGSMYSWARVPAATRGLPFDAPWLRGFLNTDVSAFGTEYREVSARLLDPATGEIRRPVFIVPRVSVKLTPDETLLPLGRGAVTFTVTLEHGARDATNGEVRLEVPDGWQKPAPQPFSLTQPDEERSYTFEVRPPANAKPGTATIRAVAVDSKGARYDVGTFLVDYPHIHPRQYTRPAEAQVVLADVTMPPVRAIGYVRGAADHEPEALIAAGLPVTVLDSATLASGDLSKFDAIVVGPRAYEVDTTLLKHNDRLIDYAKNGGRVMVQYQQQVFFAGGYAPFPLSLGGTNDRTTDETAPVTALAPDSPDLRTPNAIGSADWDGWIQERSLYCAHTWDRSYQPILSMADPGEAPISGCLLETQVGRGSWVYNALAFHRQLPGAVPGAFKLFVNLLGARPHP